MDNIRVVTKIEEFDKKRNKIYINHEFAFVLYKGEVSQYKLKAEEAIQDNIYYEITGKILPKRAKKRCLNLLQKRAYTEFKLREKMREGLYPQDVVDEAIDYVKSFHYINDYDYACQYIFYHKEVESRKKIEEKLSLNGINKDILCKAFVEAYDSEEEQLELELIQAKKLLEKRKYDAESMDWKEKQKIYLFLARKGISASVIRKVMSIQEEIVR